MKREKVGKKYLISLGNQKRQLKFCGSVLDGRIHVGMLNEHEISKSLAFKNTDRNANVPITEEAERCLMPSPFRYTYSRSLLASRSHDDLRRASSRIP